MICDEEPSNIHPFLLRCRCNPLRSTAHQWGYWAFKSRCTCVEKTLHLDQSSFIRALPFSCSDRKTPQHRTNTTRKYWASHGRLIALDKNPGVRPIRIGDTARRIIAKAILNITRQDIEEAAGSIQLCAGQMSGIEAAVHAVHTFFQRDERQRPYCWLMLAMPLTVSIDKLLY